MHSSLRSAFTLIELLVVIAIIAILSVVVILTLNPSELLRQSRDSNRLSDISTMNESISAYAADRGGSTGYSLGSSSVTYVSIPDFTATTTAGTDCSGLGGNFVSGGSFHCAASSTYRNVDGSGWIPINFTSMSTGAPLNSLPVDPTNTTSSNLYYTYQTNGTVFKVIAAPESQKNLAILGQNPVLFTMGSNPKIDGGTWVFVPGNPIFGTSNFYVMKYAAACVNINTGVALSTPTDGNGYKDNNSSSDNCTSVNGLAPAALPNAIPIVDVKESLAASYCSSIGAHLMTNNEWQTIAWNAEGQAQNWSGGSVSSGSLYSGHNDNNPTQASVPSANDSQSCVGTDGPASCGGTGTQTSQIRTLTLSNGSVIWDMGGNIDEWTNDSIIGTNEPHGSSTGVNTIELTSVTTWGTLTQQMVGASNSTWNSTQGIGELSSINGFNPTQHYFLRGGSWNGGSAAGMESLDLTMSPLGYASNIGFRCSR